MFIVLAVIIRRLYGGEVIALLGDIIDVWLIPFLCVVIFICLVWIAKLKWDILRGDRAKECKRPH